MAIANEPLAVFWDKSAETSLGTIWFAAGESPKVTEASYEMDRDLKADPLRHGKPLSEGVFIIERSPLRAVFVVSEEDRIVRVLSLSIVRL